MSDKFINPPDLRAAAERIAARMVQVQPGDNDQWIAAVHAIGRELGIDHDDTIIIAEGVRAGILATTRLRLVSDLPGEPT